MGGEGGEGEGGGGSNLSSCRRSISGNAATQREDTDLLLRLGLFAPRASPSFSSALSCQLAITYRFFPFFFLLSPLSCNSCLSFLTFSPSFCRSFTCLQQRFDFFQANQNRPCYAFPFPVSASDVRPTMRHLDTFNSSGVFFFFYLSALFCQ